MYGHIDRLSSGQVGSLMDRFSDRFGSELDREIIVLRKKQQQDLLAIKPTVELISAPESEEEDSEEVRKKTATMTSSQNSLMLSTTFWGIWKRNLSTPSYHRMTFHYSSVEVSSNCDEETRAEFFSAVVVSLASFQRTRSRISYHPRVLKYIRK